MRSLLRSIRQFLSELRRRNVYRVAVAYLAVGFVVVEAADLVFPRIDLPPWTVTLVIALVGLGFPIALVLAWALEMTPEGVRVDEPDASEGVSPSSGGFSLTSNWLIAGLLIVAIGLLLYPRIFSSQEGTVGQVSASDTTQIDERSIAVLPFEPLSSGEKTETFARGVHDDLLTRLSNISDLTVISRTSVEKYRNTDLSLPSIADSLGVRWVMEGGVLESGGQIQVNVQLIDPKSDAHVWADDYQRKLTAENLFSIQGEITGEIADALKAELTAGEQQRIAGAPTEDLGAYRLYVKGRSSLNRLTEEEVVKAVDYFKQAIRQDSSFALAWAGLADAVGLFTIFGPDSAEVQGPSPKKAARRALRLNPDLAEAHAALGGIYMVNERNPAAALRHFQRAIELKPSFATPYVRLGYLRFKQGRAEEALKLFRRAASLNPANSEARWALYAALLATGRYEEALAQAARLRGRHPERFDTPIYEIDALIHLRRWTKVREKLRRYQADSRFYSDATTAYLALTYIVEGDTSRARERLAQLQRREDPIHILVGLIHGALGESEAALSAWRDALLPDPSGNPRVIGIIRYFYPDFLDPLREDPRYETLIRDINRALGFNPDGSVPDESRSSAETTEADA